MTRAKRKAVLLAFMTFLVLSLWSSCSTEDQLHSQTSAAVEATFSLKPATAMNGKITIREAYLKLDRIQATGNLGGNNNTDITHPIPPEGPPFQLSKSDSSEIDFNLPFRIYDRLDFHLFLFPDAYDLVYQESPEISDPVEDDDGQSPDGGQEENEGENKNEDNGSDPDNDANDDGNGEDHSDDGEGDDEDDNDDSDSESDEDEDDEEENGEGDDDEDDGDDDNDKKDSDKKDKNGDKKKDTDQKDNKDRDKGDDDDDEEDDDDEDDDDGRTGKAGRQIVNLADFFQNARPGMVIMGTYVNNGRIINIIFVATGIEQITVPARQNDSFSIKLNEKNSAAITFNPEVLFDGINPADIESAQIQNYQQQEVLFIHRDFNSELFQILAPRLEPSAGLNFGVKNL
ncbi:MAG: hypothetical protein WEB30_19805 [Cyclobacteriaceae bacterium]